MKYAVFRATLPNLARLITFNPGGMLDDDFPKYPTSALAMRIDPVSRAEVVGLGGDTFDLEDQIKGVLTSTMKRILSSSLKLRKTPVS